MVLGIALLSAAVWIGLIWKAVGKDLRTQLHNSAWSLVPAVVTPLLVWVLPGVQAFVELVGSQRWIAMMVSLVPLAVSIVLTAACAMDLDRPERLSE